MKLLIKFCSLLVGDPVIEVNNQNQEEETTKVKTSNPGLPSQMANKMNIFIILSWLFIAWFI